MRNAIKISTVAISLAVLGPAHAADSDNGSVSDGRIITSERGDIVITPVEHATLVIQWDNKSLFVDPVGGGEVFQNFPKPDLILITDIHSDHLNWDTLSDLISTKTRIVMPLAAANKKPKKFKDPIGILANDRTTYINGISIKAIPMYNLTPERSRYHNKGRGNGYVLEMGGQRIYISGDTEDIPEMRALENIEAAFVCMNSPYTMTVEQAASAVLEFKPKIVYPYHYRNREGTFSDVEKFKKIVGIDKNIEVRLLKWYP